MQWKGITNNLTDIGQSIAYLENGSFFVRNECARRPGFGARIAQGGIVVGELYPRLIYVTDAGDIISHDGTTPTTMESGYNVVEVPTMQAAFSSMYITNDFDPMKVSDDGTTIRDAGIDAPTVTPAIPGSGVGICSTGTHLIRYRWYDSRRQRYSDPSDAVEGVVPPFGGISFIMVNIPSADTTVDTIIWEMTPAGEGTYYQAATSNNSGGTTTIILPDQDLVNRTPSSAYGDFGHQPPPIALLLCEHQTRMFLWGTTTRVLPATFAPGYVVTGTGFSPEWAGRRIALSPDPTGLYFIDSSTTTTITLSSNYGGPSVAGTITVTDPVPDLLMWSLPGQPESFDPVDNARRVTLTNGDIPAAMMSLHGDLYLLGQRSMRRYNYPTDPAVATIVAAPSTLGAFHQRCVCVTADGNAYGWGPDGMWLIDSMMPTRISDPILRTVEAIADKTTLTQRFVVFEPMDGVALFFFTLAGETGCKVAAAFDPASGNWQLWRYRNPMVAGCVSYYQSHTRLLLIDANDSSWRVAEAVNDGGNDGEVLAGPGSTTTVVQGPTANVGQVCYRPATGEERYVTVAAGASFTVGVAFATAPTPGETLLLGSIRVRIVTDWNPIASMSDKKRPHDALLVMRPTLDMGDAKIYEYVDFRLTPETVTAGSADVFNKGFVPIAGTTYILADLDLAMEDGFGGVPVSSKATRVVRLELIHETPLDNLRFVEFGWSADRNESDRVEQT